MFSANTSQISADQNFIEDLFGTFLYTGNNSNQTISNGIDLAGKGGLVWLRTRNVVDGHYLADTARGATTGTAKFLQTQSTASEVTSFPNAINVTNTGFSLVSNANEPGSINATGSNDVSWAFRKAPKFFDVQTFTSSASGNKTFSHALGSVPGCVFIKNTQTNDPWIVYHRSVGDNAYLALNTTAAQDPLTGAFSATATTFTISSSLMYNSQTYVAYLFAHDTTTDGVIQCGSVTSSASGPVSVNLGWEPQWILYKTSNTAGSWRIADTMRGWTVDTTEQSLQPNSTAAESAAGNVAVTSTGFSINPGGAATWVYIAIRRGPMRTPTSGTSVFAPVAQAGGGTVTTNFPIDLIVSTVRSGDDREFRDRLRGGTTTSGLRLRSNSTGAEISNTSGLSFQSNTGSTDAWYNSAQSIIYECFRRAPGFFDEVCYTGDGNADQVVNCNIGVQPELIIVKRRNTAGDWYVGTGGATNLLLNTTGAAAQQSNGYVSPWDVNQFYVSQGTSSNTGVNASGGTYVAYLFASCPGVSKVGQYTGNGGTQTINCGFAGGARFVLIKRTDAAGDWYVYDTARGMTTLTDPYLLLNSTAAESATLGSVTTVTTGFAVNASILAAINTFGASYIYLAIS